MIPNIDPLVGFILGLIVTIALAIVQAAPNLFDPSWINPQTTAAIVGICKAIATIGTPIMTYIAGSNATNYGRVQNVVSVPPKQLAEQDPRIKAVVLNSQAEADAIPGNTVLGPKDVK
jgi:hypothetical protein